eukprot:gnl/TRDRNA2_/TRDRNA2_122275_c1_seq1.p1 gnl/TRDRNA2_/TRDRNA2_122275_c1~~gnl/TRDRNA2_/TRDRNA2_122275_c1_seq1.p1  ORF type:complete len:390 (-),score=50.56 gnl/TRDRNA2_/TRDRNA2_122275_c1_seq1:21-1190(-)
MPNQKGTVGNNKSNSAPKAELLWASWESHGIGTAPPFGVVLDHSARELIVTVRGTLSIQDCIIDANVKAEPFDPLSLADEGSALLDPKNGLYAHAGMLACMRDLKERLEKRGILALLAPGGEAHGYVMVCTGHSLGAGIAALLALELHPSLGNCVRYVGFEPPGGLLSPTLARITVELGWVSSVVVHDWIPRLSLRSLQSLRESVLDELIVCPYSKLQIAAFLSRRLLLRCFMCYCIQCLITGLSSICGLLCRRLRFRRLVDAVVSPKGEPESDRHARELFVDGLTPCSPAAAALLEERRAQRNDPNFWVEPMMPPGRLIFLRPQGSELVFSGCVSRYTAWTAEWGNCEDLKDMLVVPDAVEAHFPHMVAVALTSAARNLDPDLGRPTP